MQKSEYFFKKEDYKKAIELGSKNPEVYIKFYETQSEEEKDINLIFKSIELCPTKWAYFHLLYFYNKKQNKKKLKETYLNLLKFFKDKKLEKEDKKVLGSYFPRFISDYEKATYLTNNPLEIKNLNIIQNDLQCIALLLTGKELEDGYYEHFLNQIKLQSDMNFCKNFDFKIIITKKIKKEKLKIKTFKKLFKSVEIIESDIPQELDFYLNDLTEFKNQNLKYGLKSGPNYIFFETVKKLSQYNTTLFLECDCFLGENWLERIYNYTKNAGGFWISGALYDGLFILEPIAKGHINGGIALYATGNHFFINFIDFCWKLFPFYLKTNKNLPYDYFIKQIIEDYYSIEDSRETINFINRQYIFNNLIFNYSTKEDNNIKNEQIKNIYNYAILHKKKEETQSC